MGNHYDPRDDSNDAFYPPHVTDDQLDARVAQLRAAVASQKSDLQALERIRAHACTAKLVDNLRDMRTGAKQHADFWKATADVSQVLARMELLDELITLLTRETVGGG